MNTATKKLPFGRKLSYGLGDVGASCSNLFFASYFLVYCTNCLQISAATASTILLAARVFDIVNDSWWGNWTDNAQNTKFGKYRKQMMLWIIPSFLFTGLMFGAPTGIVGTVWATVWATVMYFAWTFCFSGWNCAYTGLSAVITDDHRERGSAASLRMGLMMLSNIVIVDIITRYTGKYGESSPKGWLIAVIVLSIAGLVICAITVFGSKEVLRVEPKPKGERDGVIKNIVTCLHNKQFMLCAVVSIAVGCAVNGRNGVMAYYFIYISKDYTAIATFATCFSLGAMVGGLLFPYASDLLKSKGRACQVYAIIGIVFTFGMSAFSSNVHGIGWLGCTFMSYFGAFGLMTGFFGMTPDTAEWGYHETGKYQIGVYSAMITFWHKMGFCLVQGTVGFFLAAGGFDASVPNQPLAAQNIIAWEFFWIPCIFLALVVILMAFYKLDYATCQRIREENVAKYENNAE